MKRPRSLGGAVGLAALLLAAGAHAQSLELAVKATYLYKLAAFVGWPPGAFANPDGPLVLCVQGDDPFGTLLDRAVAGQRVAAHPVEVRRVSRLDPATGCHVAFVAGSAAQSAGRAIAAVEHAPVLTVTDEARGADRGDVNLLLQDGHVRFSVNARRAAGAGLQVSSKLLALAVEVTR